MKKINRDTLSKEINDTLIHRECVMRSGRYMAMYLIYHERNLDAVELLERCSIHDISKMQNIAEFLSLASIVDEIGTMQDVTHRLSDNQKNAIKLHWSNNKHHPEYFDSPNDMSDADLLEMACDCHARSKQHGTDLLEYIDAQQEIRFHFDEEHFKKLRTYCAILCTMSKRDDYSDIFSRYRELKLNFSLRDSTLDTLAEFDDSLYPNVLKSEHLNLRKMKNSDFASVVYIIYLNEDDSEVGSISIKCNGTINFKIFENFLNHGFEREAILALVEASPFNEFSINVRNDNLASIETARLSGFYKSEGTENSSVYRLIKKIED